LLGFFIWRKSKGIRRTYKACAYFQSSNTAAEPYQIPPGSYLGEHVQKSEELALLGQA
jgi:hypothetical protein